MRKCNQCHRRVKYNIDYSYICVNKNCIDYNKKLYLIGYKFRSSIDELPAVHYYNVYTMDELGKTHSGVYDELQKRKAIRIKKIIKF